MTLERTRRMLGPGEPPAFEPPAFECPTGMRALAASGGVAGFASSEESPILALTLVDLSWFLPGANQGSYPGRVQRPALGVGVS